MVDCSCDLPDIGTILMSISIGVCEGLKRGAGALVTFSEGSFLTEGDFCKCAGLVLGASVVSESVSKGARLELSKYVVVNGAAVKGKEMLSRDSEGLSCEVVATGIVVSEVGVS